MALPDARDGWSLCMASKDTLAPAEEVRALKPCHEEGLKNQTCLKIRSIESKTNKISIKFKLLKSLNHIGKPNQNLINQPVLPI
jgi:hypothetical protein